MLMSEISYNNMNNLAALCFNANAIIDNLAYNLDFFYYNEIADIVHHNVAHIMPEWADMITDQMLKLSARPVRKDINGYDREYKDIKEIFKVLMDTMMDIKEATRELIESADINGDDEVRIFGEDFIMIVQGFVKQADEWINAANSMDPHTLNVHIKCYTHFIAA